MNIERLKRAVAQRGNLSRLAKESGVSHSTISKIARGKIEVGASGHGTVTAIERALDEIEKQETANVVDAG